jgi:transcriptional regulator with PAS, ATPase and Fis domain
MGTSATQAKLLRVLEDGKVRRLGGKNDFPVQARVVAATNQPPEQAIQDKHLREDLYYRLNVFHIAMPPLRERKEDILAICEAIPTNLNQSTDVVSRAFTNEVLESCIAWRLISLHGI